MLGIVIPAYERKDCLREALYSLVSQTKHRFFVIVVDDHSPNPLEDVVNEFKDKLHIIYKYAEKNGGPGAARQIGLEVCYSMNLDLVMFMDSDDMLLPQAVERLTSEINHTRNDLISSNFYIETKPGQYQFSTPDNGTWLHGKIFRTDFLRKNNISFAPLRTNEDLVFCQMAFRLTDKKAYLEEPLYIFRHQEGSITRNSDIREAEISADYLRAVYTFTKELEDRGITTKQSLFDTVACYNHYQIANIHNLITEEIKTKVKWLVNRKEFVELLKDPVFFKSSKILKQYYVSRSNKIYYFTQTFDSWLKENME
jgi:CDP-glycerol glycerophosphotransferase